MRVSHVTPIKGVSSPYKGLLGLVVLDQQRQRFVAFTTAQVAGAGCLLAEDETPIASMSGNRADDYDDATIRPAWSLLAPVVLLPTVGLGENRVLTQSGRWVYPELNRNEREMLGQDVLIHLPRSAPLKATLTATRAQFAMQSPQTPSVTAFFEDALELRSADGKRLARQGDAGAMVTSMNGEAIGAIVSAIGDNTYAAPLRPALQDLSGCVSLDDMLIAARNRDAERAGLIGVPAALGGVRKLPSRDVVDMGRRWAEADAAGDIVRTTAAAGRLAEAAFRD